MDSLIALLIILLIFSCLMTVNGFQWSQLVATTSLEPPSREHAGMEWSPSALYIFGGKATTGALSKLHIVQLLLLYFNVPLPSLAFLPFLLPLLYL